MYRLEICCSVMANLRPKNKYLWELGITDVTVRFKKYLDSNEAFLVKNHTTESLWFLKQIKMDNDI